MRPDELSGSGALVPLKHLEMTANRRAAAERLFELGIPGNKTEQYRHFAIKPILAQDYRLAMVQQPEVRSQGSNLEITDGVVTSAPENAFLSFDSDYAADTVHYDALYYLSHLIAPHCITLDVKSDMQLTISHKLRSAETLVPYRIVVTAAAGCRLQVTETFDTKSSGGSLLLYGLDVKVGRDGALVWVRDQSSDAADATVIGSHRYDIGPQSEFTLQTFDFGTGISMHLYKNDLADHTETKLSHLLFASGKARRGNVINLRHNGVHGKSVHLAKSIVREMATGIFDGRIRVDQKARYTSTRQHSSAILLNDHAFMEAKPQLEIYTDELEASHGATTGQLNEASLFYLRSRGIAHDEARKMLILAFANEMIEAVEDRKVVEIIRADFESAYYQKETP